ncbi:MAG: carbon-nitrogen hydrolase family protein, partial [Planctomycetota bacterium]
PSEDRYYVPGEGRRMFAVEGVPFGIAICHEGWRYPETVRWAAVRGAQVVFHPQHTGYERGGTHLTEWGAATNPYYEQAMRMRARENTIWFASVNYGLACQESATSVIAPDGECAAHLPYDGCGLLVHELDLGRATGLLARRFAPERYRELGPA